jgi:hypothetical protein
MASQAKRRDGAGEQLGSANQPQPADGGYANGDARKVDTLTTTPQLREEIQHLTSQTRELEKE